MPCCCGSLPENCFCEAPKPTVYYVLWELVSGWDMFDGWTYPITYYPDPPGPITACGWYQETVNVCRNNGSNSIRPIVADGNVMRLVASGSDMILTNGFNANIYGGTGCSGSPVGSYLAGLFDTFLATKADFCDADFSQSYEITYNISGTFPAVYKIHLTP
jgi:hypothetical protein